MTPGRRLNAALCAGVMLCLVAGCGKKQYKVEGTVTLDGKPVEGATVTFMPEEKGVKPAYCSTDAEGRYHIMTPDGEGALRGDYIVVIIKQTPATIPTVTGPI